MNHKPAFLLLFFSQWCYSQSRIELPNDSKHLHIPVSEDGVAVPLNVVIDGFIERSFDIILYIEADFWVFMIGREFKGLTATIQTDNDGLATEPTLRSTAKCTAYSGRGKVVYQ